jgi:hypothetical protein
MEVVRHAKLTSAERWIYDDLFSNFLRPKFYSDKFFEKVQMCSSWFEILELQDKFGYYLWYYMMHAPLFQVTFEEVEGEL